MPQARPLLHCCQSVSPGNAQSTQDGTQTSLLTALFFLMQLRTRALSLPRHAHSPADMLPPVLRLLRAELPLELRLMGVRMSGLRKVRHNLSMWKKLAGGGGSDWSTDSS